MALTFATDGSAYAKTKLGMVNKCLLAIGEVPLAEGTVLEQLQPGTDGAIARDVVENVFGQVQGRGWFFNTDYQFPFLPDENNFIIVPNNLLRLDAGNTSGGRQTYLLKGNRLYNLATQSYTFTAKVLLDTVWLTDYAELPFNAFEYISLRAARQFQQSVIGSTELDSFTVRDETNALLELQREQLQYKDYNMIPNSIKPYYANRVPGAQ